MGRPSRTSIGFQMPNGQSGSPNLNGGSNNSKTKYYGDASEPGSPKQSVGIPPMIVSRPRFQQEELNRKLDYHVPKRHMCEKISRKADKFSCLGFVKSVFPILVWLREYSWKRDFVADLIAGCTVGVMHIPQGMGYALLATVPPIVGIYMAFFPVLIYFMLGTSRHNSMGTFAVISIMVGKVVLTHSTAGNAFVTGAANATAGAAGAAMAGLPTRDPVQVATAVCFVVGVMQILMYSCRMGVMSYLLSDTLISGFTTGAALHVFTSQVKEILGLTMPPIVGNFKIVRTYYHAIAQITEVNLAVLLMSGIAITVLVINNEYLKPIVAKYTIVPIPIQLIVVIVGRVISFNCGIGETYSIKTVGHIPTGFPAPAMPDSSLFNAILLDCFSIAVVSYAISVSMGMIFSQKENYEISFNQELLAMGASNIFGSFFSCMPLSASLSRSMVNYLVGAKTQLSAVISCSILAVVLLWIGPYFEPLPRCILSAIIVVALKGLLMQVKEFFVFLKMSYMDAMLWMVTFLTVVLVNIDIGLLVGMGLSVFCIFFKGMMPYTCLLQNVPNTDLYLDVNRYNGTVEIFNVKIFHFCGSLNFATRAGFKYNLCKALKLNILEEIKQLNQGKQDPEEAKRSNQNLRYLVLDFSAVSNIDSSACSMIKSLIADLERLSVSVAIAGMASPIYEVMVKCGLVGGDQEYCALFPTVHDAVLWTKEGLAMDSKRVSTYF
ncbi:sulfate anion transporter 1-like [Uranotaenia lowii]|uniref:sulfate anion transporter 1-like n=1 Tax=Uranotaenia lowii TaxID=190385 RepID=UPI00247A501E|nr:sulfate anion transporter 1-like [Uranotaenia lowii]